jgi:1-pyrroline-5-carboxylate dehydrogenase
LLRGAFEYQGQKCSAASRAYIPRSVWTRLEDPFLAQVDSLTMGDVSADLSLFLGAVIDARAFHRLSDVLASAPSRPSIRVLTGGNADGAQGYFVRPTVLHSPDPADEIFTTEYFGPILAVHVYPDAAYEQTLSQAADVAPYALTGAILATDRAAIAQAAEVLRYSAGNFYINDKPTGAVVGRQPFGGARASGTNDKAGSIWNLTRWVNARAIKELFAPPTDYRYPHMG